MLKVTIELWPFGDDTKRQVIAEAEIWNDGDHPDRPKFGNYKGVFHGNGVKHQSLQVNDHERGLGAWVLLGRFLSKILPNARTSEDEPGLSEKSSDS